ncbi:MFS transporter [Microlunatus soli]|uniref:Major Facilitator Superfamily protein n=1 Tax=Microlunatus soli TaxID=630515 RepID=A0A1H1RJJ7_9ACTN|nr:MFS transporter [Microlunatus soli]SDS35852.1 Major Facilitator Superfamily protein [Microlunatus soli]
MRRANLLILASAVAMLGWGTVLPYQYAYAADTRGWGGMAGAAAATMFSVGALLAAPLGGRLADRHNPAAVAMITRLLAAVAALCLISADHPVTFLAAMALFGFGLAGGSPAQSVLALRWAAGAGDRRRIFAWLASGQALGMGLGSFIAGFLVDLDRTDGMLPAFTIAAGGFALSSILIGIAGRGVNDLTSPPTTSRELDARPGQAWKLIFSSRPLLLVTVINVAIALAYHAQFESGLPAYGLTVLHISEETVGIAAAINCLVILALQMLVIRWTAGRSAAGLLMIVGGIWVLCWMIMGAAAHLPELSSVIFVSTFGLFAFGETLFAPVLNPLVASLTPTRMVGMTLGLFTAFQTGATAVGPLLSGATLGAGLSWLFIAGNIAISLVAVVGGRLLQQSLSRRTPTTAAVATAG